MLSTTGMCCKNLVICRDEALLGHDLYPLFQKAEAMARFIVPEEYGSNSFLF